jgi:hypothetical protein
MISLQQAVKGRWTLRNLRFLDNRFSYGGEVVSLMHGRALPPGRFLMLISVFLLEANILDFKSLSSLIPQLTYKGVRRRYVVIMS